MIGAMIGQYRVTRLIGQGGMGAVYAAEHALIGRVAAIKLLLPQFSKDAEIVQRFFNEAKAATAIQHPGIVEIYDFGWSPDGAAYIVMEMLRGESLSTRLQRERLGWSQALAVVRQIAGVLGAAHERGIVHRDLKPDNIYLTPDPEVPSGERIKLLDFGIAKLAQSDAFSTNKTRTGSVMGTPTYMAPEQCRGVAVDHRADLYALGCILFEIVTGRPPFVGEGVGDVLAAHIHVPPPSLQQLVQGAPPAIDALVQQLLAKSPDQRPQHARDVVRAIDAISSTGSGAAISRPEVTGAAHLASVPTTLSGATASVTSAPVARSRTPLVAGLAVAVIAIVGVVIATRGGGGDARPPEPAATHAKQAEPPAPPPPPPAVIVDAAVVEIAPDAATTIAVTIASKPAGAKLRIDSQLVGTTPYRGELPLVDRDLVIALELSGHKPKTITARGTAPIVLDVKLDKKRDANPSMNRNDSVNPF